MLPFFFKEHRNSGKKRATKRRRQDVVPSEECGGPVQKAIIDDLINLRAKIRVKIVEYRNEHSASSLHWRRGTAFSIFKEAFGSAKIAMLHLLPPARVDREAYSQLIYAACLSLFKESFLMAWENFDKDSSNTTNGSCDSCNHYDDACFAIFSLFALFETNPLPRHFDNDNPLELLPVSLRPFGDPETCYRRCFSKHIRVDRNHFSLLLRLKELSLVKKCGCERFFYEQQRLRLRRFNDLQQVSGTNDEEGVLRCCGCGIAADVLEILDRIFPCLQLSEYTGPVGAEAFAGHPEYPYSQSIAPQKSPQNAAGKISYKADDGVFDSNELSTMLGRYKSRVAAIQIPSSKSYAVKCIQGALGPLLSSTKGWSEHSIVDVSLQIEGNQDHEKTKSATLPDVTRKYKIKIEGEISYNLRKQLQSSIAILLRKDKPFPLPSDRKTDSPNNLRDKDDISSIGCGGISIATGQGRNALHNLLSAAGGKVPSKESQPVDQKRVITNPSLANLFLTANDLGDSAVSSDENSVDSEISIESFSDADGTDQDEVSVATSAFGNRALDDLLQTVMKETAGTEEEGKEKKTVSRRKKVTKRKNGSPSLPMRTRGNKKDDEISVATSAFGQQALDNLLRTVKKEGVNSAKERKKSSVKKSKRGKKETHFLGRTTDGEDNEDLSIATSTLGKRALEDLILSATKDGSLRGNQDKRTKPSSQKNRGKKKEIIRDSPSPRARYDKEATDETSVGTSTYGKRALEELLQTAVGQEVISNKDSVQRGKRKKASASQKTRGKKTNGTSLKAVQNKIRDETSVATSTYGKRALEELLQTAAGEEVISNEDSVELGKRKRKKPVSTQKTRRKKTDTTSSKAIQNEVQDDISTATSAFGKRALDELLEIATQDDT